MKPPLGGFMLFNQRDGVCDGQWVSDGRRVMVGGRGVRVYDGLGVYVGKVGVTVLVSVGVIVGDSVIVGVGGFPVTEK